MATENILDLDLMTPGSVFTREDGRESRFLFLTNTNLPKRLQKEFPPQVVYADENANILSCSITRFLKKRNFLNVDPELEDRLNKLLVTESTEPEDSLDLDNGDDDLLVVGENENEGENFMDAFTEGEDGGEIAQGEDDPFLNAPPSVLNIKFIPQSDLPAVINPEVMASAVSSYQQSPNLADGSLQHTLFIRAEEGITQESLHASFSPSRQEQNAIFTFQVDLDGRTVEVDWDSFHGVYPCVFFSERMYQVIFSTVRAENAAETVVEPAEAQVVVAAEPIAEAQPVVVNAGVATPAATVQPAVAPAQPAVTVQPVAAQAAAQ